MRKALLVLGICILAVPAWAGGGFSLFGSYAQLSDDSEGLGAGGRFTFGGPFDDCPYIGIRGFAQPFKTAIT